MTNELKFDGRMYKIEVSVKNLATWLWWDFIVFVMVLLLQTMQTLIVKHMYKMESQNLIG